MDSANAQENASHCDSAEARETRRLAALRSYDLPGSAPTLAFDELTQLAAYICGTPMAAISLVEESRQRIISKIGISVNEVQRDVRFVRKLFFKKGFM